MPSFAAGLFRELGPEGARALAVTVQRSYDAAFARTELEIARERSLEPSLFPGMERDRQAMRVQELPFGEGRLAPGQPPRTVVDAIANDW